MKRYPSKIETNHFHNKNHSIMKEFRNILIHFREHYWYLGILIEI